MARPVRRFSSVVRLFFAVALFHNAAPVVAEVPLEGFIPLVGMGLTDEFRDIDQDVTFFISDPRSGIGGNRLGSGGTAFADIALFDTGAATHILTSEASSSSGFDIAGNGFDGINIQPIGGATGIVDLLINDPHGIYAAGLGDRSSLPGAPLQMNPVAMRGQTSFATLSAQDSSWELPNIIGMPLAAAHRVHIKNSEPIVYEQDGRTVRTPQIEFLDLGGGGLRRNVGGQAIPPIERRAILNLNPGIGFATGPIYVYDTTNAFTGKPFHEDPTSPSVVENGGLFIGVEMENGSRRVDRELLFDTGASLTVLSSDTAVRLGIDPIRDKADFTLAVEGSGGVSSGIPGYYVEKLSLYTAGGSFELENVPVAVLDVANPADPGNLIPGILGMNVFADHDLIIDANPALGGAGNPPALYISETVTNDCTWSQTASTGSMATDGNWSGNARPDYLCEVTVANVSGSHQQAVAPDGEFILMYGGTLSGSLGAEMTVDIQGAQGGLIVYSDLVVEKHARLHLGSEASVKRVDAQFVAIEEGSLTGSGKIFVGAGPLDGTVRNNGGLIAPGDPNGNPIGHIDVDGDIANQATLEFDLGGTSAGQFDELTASRNIYLEGELNINLVDLDGAGIFMPSVGDTFDIITVGDRVVGSFDVDQDSFNFGGYSWDINYFPRFVQLEVTGSSSFACDADGDGDCDVADLNAMYVAFGTSGPLDFDGNGTVDAGDIQGWLNAASSPGNPAKLSSADLYKIGDINLDGDVNSTDLGLLLNNFGNETSLGWGDGNLNGDEFVDSTDLGLMLNEFGHASAAATVPEPGSIVMLLIGLVMFVGRSRRR